MDIIHILLSLVIVVCLMAVYVTYRNMSDEKVKVSGLIKQADEYRNQQEMLNHNNDVLTSEIEQLNKLIAEKDAELTRVNDDFDEWSSTQAEQNKKADKKLASQVAHYGKLKKTNESLKADLNAIATKFNELSFKLSCGFKTNYFSYLGSYFNVVQCKAPSVKNKAKKAIADFTAAQK